jgi:hypothetical protein
VFGAERVRYVFTLLDDLQSRLDPGAVTVVRSQLARWQECVEGRIGSASDNLHVEAADLPWEPVECQALVWRQLLTGDKEPEAYLGPEQRAAVRDELWKLMRRRYRGWLVAAGAAVGALTLLGALVGGDIADWYGDNPDFAASLTGLVLSIAGVFGLTRASMVLAMRNSVRTWTELLWNRALSYVVCEATLRLDDVFGGARKQRAAPASGAIGKALRRAQTIRIGVPSPMSRRS